MLVKNEDRRAAYNSVINTMLRDRTKYCNLCGAKWVQGVRCCEEPEIGTNWDIARAVIEDCRYLRESAKDDHASFANKSMRLGIKLPVFIYEALENYERSHGRKFLDKEEDIMWMSKNFPQFSVPRKV